MIAMIKEPKARVPVWYLKNKEVQRRSFPGLKLGVNNTQIDSIQYLNFAKK